MHLASSETSWSNVSFDAHLLKWSKCYSVKHSSFLSLFPSFSGVENKFTCAVWQKNAGGQSALVIKNLAKRKLLHKVKRKIAIVWTRKER